MSYLATKMYSEAKQLEDVQEAIAEACNYARLHHINVELVINCVVLYIAPYDSVNKIWNLYKDTVMEEMVMSLGIYDNRENLLKKEFEQDMSLWDIDTTDCPQAFQIYKLGYHLGTKSIFAGSDYEPCIKHFQD